MLDCKNLQELLITKRIQNISPDEETDVAAHIKACAECRRFQQRIVSLTATTSTPQEVHLSSHVRNTLLQHMRLKNKPRKRESLWRRYLSSRRITVYQAAAAAALVLFFFIITSRIKDHSGSADHLSMLNVADVEMLNVISVQQVHQIVDSQKVGVKLSQDTLLSKILFTL